MMSDAVRTITTGPYGTLLFSGDGTKLYINFGRGLDIYSLSTGGYLGDLNPKGFGGDITPNGQFLISVDSTLGAGSGNTYPYTVSVYRTDLVSGTQTTYQMSGVVTSTIGYPSVPSFTDAIALNDTTVLLAVSGEGRSGYLLDLTTGNFTQTNAIIGRATLTESIEGTRVLAATGAGALTVLDMTGAVLATHAAGQDGITGYSSGIEAISTTAGRVLQYVAGALDLYDLNLHFLGDIQGTLQAQIGRGEISNFVFSKDGTLLYGTDNATNALYEFRTSDWHLQRSFALGSTSNGALALSPDGHYIVTNSRYDVRIVDLTASNQVDGTTSNDVFAASTGLSIVYGYAGNDTFRDGSTNDTFVGGDGDDTYILSHNQPGPQDPRYYQPIATIVELPGGGNDTIITSVDMTAPENVETLQLAQGAVATITGGVSGTRLIGNDYGTLIEGGAGTDVLIGGLGDDVLKGYTPGDTAVIHATMATSTIQVSLGYVSVNPTSTEIQITSADGNDTLEGIDIIQFDDGQLTGPYVIAAALTFEQFTGRAATAAEIAALEPITRGIDAYSGYAHYMSISTAFKNAVAHSALVEPLIDARIAQSYLTYGGRAPSAAELDVWENQFSSYATFDSLRESILRDPLGQAYYNAQVADLYQQYGGRAPTASELGVWRNAFLQGYNDSAGALAGVRQAILQDPLGQNHFEPAITALYQEYGGRAPTSSELAVWRQYIFEYSKSYDYARTTILTDRLGQTHSSEQITKLYQEYGGRAPTNGEIDVWRAELLKGATFHDVRTAILDDALGQNHTTAAMTGIYQLYFGRAPSVDEISVWKGLVRAGADFFVATDTLMSDAGSIGHVQRATGTDASDTFTYAGSFGNVAVDAFDPLHDVLDLRGSAFAGANPLDAAHAHQVTGFDGSTDVLLTFDATDHILLHHVSLAQLSGSNFLI
jgi:Ca2+-binding RTX toxin-like protein